MPAIVDMDPRDILVLPVAKAVAVPWRNGGGVTRELLAWPDSKDWALRVSVADIAASGPFSGFPGVDRWFAVLSGGAVQLSTAGTAPRELSAVCETLHAFAGDKPTHCTMQGGATRDFNLMVRRDRARIWQQPVRNSPVLATRAQGAGLFVTAPVTLQEDGGAALSVPAMALVWCPNPQRSLRRLRVNPADTVRGWWFEVETDLTRAS